MTMSRAGNWNTYNGEKFGATTPGLTTDGSSNGSDGSHEIWFPTSPENHTSTFPRATSNATTAAAECELLRAENARITAELLGVTAEATRVATDAARLKAEVSQLQLEVSRLSSGGSECGRLRTENTILTAENAGLKADVLRITSETTRIIGGGGAQMQLETWTAAAVTDVPALKLLISERVGSVSEEQFARLTEDGGSKLDAALKRIITRTCCSGVGPWPVGAKIIRDELATVGLHLSSAKAFSNKRHQDWQNAKNPVFSDLRRITYALGNCRASIGTDWYPDEMVRIVKRLMELRGFPL